MKETLIGDQNYVKLVVDKHREAQLLTTARVPGVGKRCKWPNCYCVTRMQITPSYARNSRWATSVGKVQSHSPVNLRNHRTSEFPYPVTLKIETTYVPSPGEVGVQGQPGMG